MTQCSLLGMAKYSQRYHQEETARCVWSPLPWNTSGYHTSETERGTELDSVRFVLSHKPLTMVRFEMQLSCGAVFCDLHSTSITITVQSQTVSSFGTMLDQGTPDHALPKEPNF